jgi:hypothetical protein
VNGVAAIAGNLFLGGANPQGGYMLLSPSNGIYQTTGAFYGWTGSATNANTSPDTLICRQGAGVVEIASGSSCSNSGSLQLATLTASGAISSGSHFTATSAAPSISSCGTGSPTVSGGDNFGTVVAGTVATSCVINFGTTWGAAPRCMASSGTAIASLTVNATTTQLTITGTALGGDTINWVCGSTAAVDAPTKFAAANDNFPVFIEKAA